MRHSDQEKSKSKPDIGLIIAILFLLFIFIYGMRVYQCGKAQGSKIAPKTRDLISQIRYDEGLSFSDGIR